MKKVITYGTFDLLHVGHLNLLEGLRSLGDHLTVAVSTDEFNRTKDKLCSMAYADRARIVAALKCVDHVIPECSWDQKPQDIRKYEISVFGMGGDWQGHFDDLGAYCEVIYLPRTQGISSTSLKENISRSPLLTSGG